MKALLCCSLFGAVSVFGADLSTASNSFNFVPSLPAEASALRPDSPFGINTAFNPRTADLDARLEAMQQAGMKWGRQDFTWRRIESVKGQYEWTGYDRLVDQCRASGRLLEGKKWLRNDAFGPDVFACVFTDPAKEQDTIVAWANEPYAYARINNSERGLTQYDVFGTRRDVTFNQQRTGHNPFALGESPVYILGPAGLRVNLRPDPGW